MAAKKKKEEKVTPAKKKTVEVGDVVELKNEHKCLCMTFPPGTKVKVVGSDEKGYSINNNPDDEKNGFTMIECGFDL